LTHVHSARTLPHSLVAVTGMGQRFALTTHHSDTIRRQTKPSFAFAFPEDPLRALRSFGIAFSRPQWPVHRGCTATTRTCRAACDTRSPAWRRSDLSASMAARSMPQITQPLSVSRNTPALRSAPPYRARAPKRRRRVQVGFSHRGRKLETMKLDPLWLMISLHHCPPRSRAASAPIGLTVLVSLMGSSILSEGCNTSILRTGLSSATTILSTGYRPLGSCSRAAGWSAATLCPGPSRHIVPPRDLVAIGA
jgi:hypothetical protein